MEKVYCPYCVPSEERPNGVEMVAGETQTFETKSGVIYLTRFICLECQSSSPVGMGKTAQESYENAYAAALGRCVPILKPLSWWEAIEDDYYLEIKGDQYIDVGLLQCAFATEKKIEPCDSATYTTHDQDGLKLLGVDYGKTWRCWAKRPSEAERLAAKWEEKDMPAIMKNEQIEQPAEAKPEQPVPPANTRIPNNKIVVSGLLENGLTFDHEAYEERFYAGTLLVKRFSGAVDKISVRIPGLLLDGQSFNYARPLKLSGQVRTRSSVVDGKNRLDVFVFVHEIAESNSENDVNDVTLIGNICVPPTYRLTPFDRKVSDLLIAVNRGYGKASYIPCIAWGTSAKWASANLKVGDYVRAHGRLQSRDYEKHMENGEHIKRTICELSLFKIEREE